jgi:elongation factor G
MDRSGADFFEAVSQIKDRLGANPIPLQVPIGSEEEFKGVVDLINNRAIIWNEEDMGMTFEEVDIPEDLKGSVASWREKLIESVAEQNDTLLEKFFEDPDSISEEEMMAAIREATIAMDITPILCGSAFKNKGVQTLLDAVMSYLPSPLDVGAVEGTNPETDKIEKRDPNSSESMSALAFKIATDPYVGRLCFFRMYSGKLDAGSYVINSRTGKKERISRIFQMHSNKQNAINCIEAGDIGAAVGFKDIRTGDTLYQDKPVVLESMTFPDPVIGVAVEPKTQADVDKMGAALGKLAEEDPTFTIRTDQDSNQTIISGMGELHLEIIVDRLKREFKVECNQGAPQVSYKEAITSSVTHREVYKKQSGGRGKFADIQFELSPIDTDFEGEGLQFVNEIKGGNIPKEYIPSVQKGFEMAMQNGVLAGYNIDSMKVRLFDGSFHDVDSDALSFELCSKIAFRAVCKQANPVLMEPIMKLEVVTPEENTGDVVADINRRRGQLEGMDSRAGAQVVNAKVPLSEMFGYVTALRTITSGRATSTMEFSKYHPAPKNIAEEVIENIKGTVVE